MERPHECSKNVAGEGSRSGGAVGTSMGCVSERRVERRGRAVEAGWLGIGGRDWVGEAALTARLSAGRADSDRMRINVALRYFGGNSLKHVSYI